MSCATGEVLFEVSGSRTAATASTFEGVAAADVVDRTDGGAVVDGEPEIEAFDEQPAASTTTPSATATTDRAGGMRIHRVCERRARMSTVVVNQGAPRTAGSRAGRLALGPGLRQAWIGYQRRLDDAMAAAGFDDRGFPDTRVLRMCADPAEMTVSEIGRQLGMTRQGAAKVVASLRDRKYVTVTASKTSGREKVVKLTPRAVEYLETFRKVTRRIERQLRNEIGADAFDALARLLDALGGASQPRMRDYLQRMERRSGLTP